LQNLYKKNQHREVRQGVMRISLLFSVCSWWRHRTGGPGDPPTRRLVTRARRNQQPKPEFQS